MALELSNYILVFQDDNVYRHPLKADPYLLPQGTWALSDSDEVAKRPCTAFLDAAKRKVAWIVQTTSPLEERYKEWSKQRDAEMFVMDYFSINELMAIGLVLTSTSVSCSLNPSSQHHTQSQSRCSPTHL